MSRSSFKLQLYLCAEKKMAKRTTPALEEIYHEPAHLILVSPPYSIFILDLSGVPQNGVKE